VTYCVTSLTMPDPPSSDVRHILKMMSMLPLDIALENCEFLS